MPTRGGSVNTPSFGNSSLNNFHGKGHRVQSFQLNTDGDLGDIWLRAKEQHEKRLNSDTILTDATLDVSANSHSPGLDSPGGDTASSALGQTTASPFDSSFDGVKQTPDTPEEPSITDSGPPDRFSEAISDTHTDLTDPATSINPTFDLHQTPLASLLGHEGSALTTSLSVPRHGPFTPLLHPSSRASSAIDYTDMHGSRSILESRPRWRTPSRFTSLIGTGAIVASILSSYLTSPQSGPVFTGPYASLSATPTDDSLLITILRYEPPQVSFGGMHLSGSAGSSVSPSPSYLSEAYGGESRVIYISDDPFYLQKSDSYGK